MPHATQKVKTSHRRGRKRNKKIPQTQERSHKKKDKTQKEKKKKRYKKIQQTPAN